MRSPAPVTYEQVANSLIAEAGIQGRDFRGYFGSAHLVKTVTLDIHYVLDICNPACTQRTGRADEGMLATHLVPVHLRAKSV